MGGKTGPQEVDRAYWASVWFCVGIWAFEAQMVILRVFYALRDTKTPMKVAVSMVALNLSLNLTLVWFLQEGGIALSTTIAAAVQSMVLLAILQRKLGRLGITSLAGSLAKGIIATAVMLLACWTVTGLLRRVDLGGADRTSRLLVMALVQLPVIVAAAGGTYVLMAKWLGMAELGDMPLVGRWVRRIEKR